MRGGYSCYLDLLRVLAAGIVFLHHLGLEFGCYASGTPECRVLTTLVPFHAGHSAVVVFFVLSGYVITLVANERETTVRDFGLARLARIYSVALPTLALVMAIDGLWYALGHQSAVPVYQYVSLWKYLPLILAFATDHWFLNENAFSLGAWWSLAYEVWYYVAFAAFFYFVGWRRWVLSAAILLIMGPKLVVMFPLWLLGSLVYAVQVRFGSLGARAAWVIFILTTVAATALLLSSATERLDDWLDVASGGWISHRLRFSQWFAGDLILAVVVAVNVFVARSVPFRFGGSARPIRYLAGYTFTFYMIHGPVQKVFAEWFDRQMLMTAVATIAFTWAFGMITEQQKGRVRRLLERAIPRQMGSVLIGQ